MTKHKHAQYENYRDSHQKKGNNYHMLFSKNPHRALIWKMEQKILTKIVHKFVNNGPIQHLDFACGTGRIISFLEPLVETSTGVDVSSSMLEVAENVTKNANLIHADITRENVLGEEKFNLITAFRFFPNAEPSLRLEALASIKKYMKPGAIFIFNNHKNNLCPGHLITRLGHSIIRLVTFNQKGRYRLMSHKEVFKLMSDQGFEILSIYHTGILPETERIFFPFRPLVELIEKFAMYVPFLKWFSHNIIYVCLFSIYMSRFTSIRFA